MKQFKIKKIQPQELLAKISKKIDFPGLLAKITQEITKITKDRNKLILAIFVILIILFLDFSFGLKSQRRALARINPKIVRLRKGLGNLNSDLIRMQRQEAGLTDIQVKEMISSGQKAWVSEEIFRLANKQQVKISQLKTERGISASKTSQESPPTEEYSSILIDLDVSAGYHQLARFLAELENHSILLEVEELDIKRSDKNPFEHKINSRLKTYVSDE